MTPPPYALPLRIRKAAEAFAVEDANGVALASRLYPASDRCGSIAERQLINF